MQASVQVGSFQLSTDDAHEPQGKLVSRRVAVRTDQSADWIRSLAPTIDDGRQRRRLYAIAVLLDGAGRAEAAAIGHMDWQTLRDWVY